MSFLEMAFYTELTYYSFFCNTEHVWARSDVYRSWRSRIEHAANILALSIFCPGIIQSNFQSNYFMRPYINWTTF